MVSRKPLVILVIYGLLLDLSGVSALASPPQAGLVFHHPVISAFRDQALAEEPLAPYHARIRLRVSAMASRLSRKMKSAVDPHKDYSPANSLAFAVAKRFGLKGKRAVWLGSISALIEYIIGVFFVSHFQQILQGNLHVSGAWFKWGPLPGWIVPPLCAIGLAFGFAFLYRLIEHRNISQFKQHVQHPLSDKLWNKDFWARFSVFAAYAILAFPILHDPNHLDFLSPRFVIAAIAVGGWHAYSVIRAFRRELEPSSEADINSRGVLFGTHVRDQVNQGKYVATAVLDMDDLSAYGKRVRSYGSEIMNHVLQRLLWDRKNGVIAQMIETKWSKEDWSGIEFYNVGGDETYLCFSSDHPIDEARLEEIQKDLSDLRLALIASSAALFEDVIPALKGEDEAKLPKIMEEAFQLHPEWKEPLRQVVAKNPKLPALTFSGGVIPFDRLESNNYERVKGALNSNNPRELFSIIRASLMESVEQAKKNKRDYSPASRHIVVGHPKKIRNMFFLENLFSAGARSGITRKEQDYISQRDPRAPFPGLSNIPVENQFRDLESMEARVAKIQGSSSREAIIGSVRHSFSGEMLLEFLQKLNDLRGVRSDRGGTKLLNLWDKTLSVVDLIMTYLHMQLLKSLQAKLGDLKGFTSGEFLVAAHARSPGKLVFIWFPNPKTSKADPLDDFAAMLKGALDNYKMSIEGAIAPLDKESMSIFPRGAILRTTDPLASLKDDLSLRLIQDSFDFVGDERFNVLEVYRREARRVESSGDKNSIQLVVVDAVTQSMKNLFDEIETSREKEAQAVLLERIVAEGQEMLRHAKEVLESNLLEADPSRISTHLAAEAA